MLNNLVLGGPNNTFPTDLEIFITAAVIVAVAAVLVAGRRREDPRGLRPAARYLSAICVLTMFVSLYAAFGTTQALTDLVVDHTLRRRDTRAEQNAELNSSDSGFSFSTGGGVFLPIGTAIFDFSDEPNNDSNFAAAMASGLVAITAAGVFIFHARWRRRLAAADEVPLAGSDAAGDSDPDDAVVRVSRAYHYGVCFVSAITVAVGAASAAFGIFEIVAPGVAVGGNGKVGRAVGVSELASFGALAIVALLIFRSSWRRAGRVDFSRLRAALSPSAGPAPAEAGPGEAAPVGSPAVGAPSVDLDP
jgi:hypothetical protein